MNTVMSLLFLVGVFDTAYAPQESGGTRGSQQEIRRLLDEQAKAWNAGDIDRFMTAYWQSPNLTFSSSGKVVRGWQGTLDRYKERYATRELMGRLKFDELEFTELSSEAVLVLGRWHLDRGELSIGGNFTLVLRQIESEWKIIHDHTSTLEDENSN